MSGLFVTGTDTGVGKTLVSAALTRCLHESGRRVLAVKPVCSGGRSDAALLAMANRVPESPDMINPFAFDEPLSPDIAAQRSGATAPDVGRLMQWIRPLQSRYDLLVVEGAGGWHVPLNDNELLSDFARQLGYPVLLVAANRLGCINHTLLTLEAIRAAHLDCPGVILNEAAPDPSDCSRPLNATAISRFIPVLAEISFGGDPVAAINQSAQLMATLARL